MTVIADRIPTSPIGSDEAARRRRAAEACRRRQDALVRLAARRMPLPGPQYHQPAMVLADPAPVATPNPEHVELPRPALTEREVQVLRTWLMLDSKPAAAQRLYISLGTVNTHLTRIRAKYAEIGRPASTKAALVARAVQDGLMSLDEL